MQHNRTRNHLSTVEVELTVVNSSAVAGQVRAGEADLGFVEGALPPQGLRHRTIAHDRLVVVVAPDHPWTRRRQPITAPQLTQTPLIVREHGSGTREVLAVAVTKALGTSAGLMAPALSLPTTAAVRAAVVAGAGPAVLSELAVADDIAAGRLRAVPIEALDLARDLRAVYGAPPGLWPERPPSYSRLQPLQRKAADPATKSSPLTHWTSKDEALIPGRVHRGLNPPRRGDRAGPRRAARPQRRVVVIRLAACLLGALPDASAFDADPDQALAVVASAGLPSIAAAAGVHSNHWHRVKRPVEDPARPSAPLLSACLS